MGVLNQLPRCPPYDVRLSLQIHVELTPHFGNLEHVSIRQADARSSSITSVGKQVGVSEQRPICYGIGRQVYVFLYISNSMQIICIQSAGRNEEATRLLQNSPSGDWI